MARPHLRWRGRSGHDDGASRRLEREGEARARVDAALSELAARLRRCLRSRHGQSGVALVRTTRAACAAAPPVVGRESSAERAFTPWRTDGWPTGPVCLTYPSSLHDKALIEEPRTQAEARPQPSTVPTRSLESRLWFKSRAASYVQTVRWIAAFVPALVVLALGYYLSLPSPGVGHESTQLRDRGRGAHRPGTSSMGPRRKSCPSPRGRTSRGVNQSRGSRTSADSPRPTAYPRVA